MTKHNQEVDKKSAEQPVIQDERVQKKSDETAIAKTDAAAVETRRENNIQNALLNPVDFNEDLPDLDEAAEIPFDLMSDYWTPENRGETKRVFFDCLQMRQVLDQATGEVIDLLSAYFYEKVDGQIKRISNGSKRLVGIFEGGAIKQGTPLQITYLGKKKNATNQFHSDMWSVKPLLIKVKSVE